MERTNFKSDKKGLDRYTELIWRGFLENEFKDIVGKKVVDMGCGDGRYTGNLSNYNEYYGVDTNPKAAMATIVGPVESIPLPDGSVDEIVGVGILDYSEPDTTVKEARRLLKKGGKLRVMVPNTMSPYHLFRVLLGFNSYKKTFVWGEMVGLMWDNGFKIEKHHEDGFCFYVPTKALQELFIPIYLFFNRFFGSMMGNNIYIRAVKQ
jgi:ubiquinone/menaquinone biosynthesis C-methylase UbiE